MYTAFLTDFMNLYRPSKLEDEPTVEQLEQELVQLKKDVDKRAEMELIDRLTYTLQNSLLYLEDSIEELENLVSDLKQSVGAGSEVFRLHIAIYTSRMETQKKKLEERKARLDACVKQMTDYNFAHQRKDLDEQIQEAKKRAEEEAAKPPEEPKGD